MTSSLFTATIACSRCKYLHMHNCTEMKGGFHCPGPHLALAPPHASADQSPSRPPGPTPEWRTGICRAPDPLASRHLEELSLGFSWGLDDSRPEDAGQLMSPLPTRGTSTSQSWGEERCPGLWQGQVSAGGSLGYWTHPLLPAHPTKSRCHDGLLSDSENTYILSCHLKSGESMEIYVIDS